MEKNFNRIWKQLYFNNALFPKSPGLLSKRTTSLVDFRFNNNNIYFNSPFIRFRYNACKYYNYSPQLVNQLPLKNSNLKLNESHISNQTSLISTTNHNNLLQNHPLQNIPLQNIPRFSSNQVAIKTLFEKYKDEHLDQAFYLANVGAVKRQYQQWIKELPRVVPFYAVKCNPDQVLVSTLHQLNCKFDCASAGEIKLCLSLGVPPENILFAHPVKNIKDLQYAASVGVNKMTFDNMDELYKIKEHHPQAELIIRLLPDDSSSIMKFGSKFGASYDVVESLLLTAKQLNLKVIGCSFHIGSGCFNPNAYEKAIKLSKDVHNLALKLNLPKFTIVDIGGGLSGVNTASVMDGKTIPAFKEFSTAINNALDKYFPKNENLDVQVIAELGRYFATQFQTLFTIVHGKRKQLITSEKKQQQYKLLYYVMNSTYDSFNCVYNDHYQPKPLLLKDLFELLETNNGIRHINKLKTNLYYISQNQKEYENQIKQYSFRNQNNYCNKNNLIKIQHSQGFVAKPQTIKYKSTVYGSTCDGIDCIAKDITIEELSIGDWLAFQNMGSYTVAAGSTFNGFKRAVIYYYES